jgi:hypothetical protein
MSPFSDVYIVFALAITGGHAIISHFSQRRCARRSANSAIKNGRISALFAQPGIDVWATQQKYG